MTFLSFSLNLPHFELLQVIMPETNPASNSPNSTSEKTDSGEDEVFNADPYYQSLSSTTNGEEHSSEENEASAGNGAAH